MNDLAPGLMWYSNEIHRFELKFNRKISEFPHELTLICKLQHAYVLFNRLIILNSLAAILPFV